jgi:hypothetical protein
MPFFIFRVAKGTAEVVLVEAFPVGSLAEADAFRRAETALRRRRRALEPSADGYLHLAYGDTEEEARTRLQVQLGLEEPPTSTPLS